MDRSLGAPSRVAVNLLEPQVVRPPPCGVTPSRGSIADAAVVLSSGIVVASAFSLLFWTIPLADDFCSAGVQTGWPQFVARRYWLWSGRWAAMGLYGAVWPRFDITSAQYAVALASG